MLFKLLLIIFCFSLDSLDFCALRKEAIVLCILVPTPCIYSVTAKNESVFSHLCRFFLALYLFLLIFNWL